MKDGFVKIACATPDIKVADAEYNAREIISLIKDAAVSLWMKEIESLNF